MLPTIAMTDTVKLKTAIASKGLKSSYIIDKLGISGASYYDKMSGKREFNITEIRVLVQLLELSDTEVMDIFFNRKMKNAN